jgi:methyl-accepting chemotaxis protein
LWQRQPSNPLREDAERGEAMMEKMKNSMGTLRSSSCEIREAIGINDEVAFQTNLLVLNAAVKAKGLG